VHFSVGGLFLIMKIYTALKGTSSLYSKSLSIQGSLIFPVKLMNSAYNFSLLDNKEDIFRFPRVAFLYRFDCSFKHVICLLKLALTDFPQTFADYKEL
jgi:hypothetical protein